MISKNIYLLLFLLTLGFTPIAVGQTSSAKAKKEALELLQVAKEYMAVENYVAANKSFREMLELNTVLPTEMCYFFANTLYHLKQFDNSLRFAEKYETLTGTGGEYYQENQELKNLLDQEMQVIRACTFCDNLGYVLEKCNYCEGEGSTTQSCIKCYGQKEHKCKICNGEGVVIIRNNFGQQSYQTCPTCKGTAIQECSHCNGTGTTDRACIYCNGSGTIRSNTLCSHKNPQ